MAHYTYDFDDLEKHITYFVHPQYDDIHIMQLEIHIPDAINRDQDTITLNNLHNYYVPEVAIPTVYANVTPLIGDPVTGYVSVADYVDEKNGVKITMQLGRWQWRITRYRHEFTLFQYLGSYENIKNTAVPFAATIPSIYDKNGDYIMLQDYSWMEINNRSLTFSTGAPNYNKFPSAISTGSISVNDGTLEDFRWKPASSSFTHQAYNLGKITSGHAFKDPDDPNPGDGDSHGGGGGGTDDLGGDPIEDTGVPTIEATDSGLMTLYNPTVSELQALGRFLWSDGLDLNSFKKLFNDPFDTLLGLSIIPIVPPTSGTKKIMFGNLDSGVSAKVISHQFVPNVDMGTITLGEVYNGALDYSPFTTVSIYLPFIGYRELNVQDIMNSKIHLVYKFDVLTGGCIAELYVDHLKTGNKSKDNSKFKWGSHSGLLASFEGQCAVNIPLASQDYTNTIRAMIGAVGMVGGAAASFATGNPALGVAALAVGSANSAMQASTPTVQRSGHLSSSNAIMANLTPFLTVTRPHQCKPSKYYKLRGVPSQIYVSKLSNLATSKHDYYLQVAEIPDIKVAGATDTEIAEIKNLLKEGVVL